MLLREDFDPFWRYRSAHWAGLFLDRWCTRVMRSRNDPMKKVARSLRTHRALLLKLVHGPRADFDGAVEGLNNKAKLTTKKAYGFRTYRCLEIALYHTLGHLPEPEVTPQILLRNRKIYDHRRSSKAGEASFRPW